MYCTAIAKGVPWMESQAFSSLSIFGSHKAAEATGLTPLVGRETEVTLLRERWAQSRDRLGQVVALSGEAGLAAIVL
jgi:hypothetical protein